MATKLKTKTTRPAAGDPWEATVNVILDVENHTFKFETDLPMGPNNEISFYNDGQPGFVITYHLQDPRHGYAFPENLDEALFSTKDPVCPTSHGQWGQFKAKAVTDNGINLVVRNLNKDKHRFGYTLRVTKDGGLSFWNLDPIGGNENGSYQRA